MPFKIKEHGFCQEWNDLEKHLSVLQQLSMFDIFESIFEAHFSGFHQN